MLMNRPSLIRMAYVSQVKHAFDILEPEKLTVDTVILTSPRYIGINSAMGLVFLWFTLDQTYYGSLFIKFFRSWLL